MAIGDKFAGMTCVSAWDAWKGTLVANVGGGVFLAALHLGASNFMWRPGGLYALVGKGLMAISCFMFLRVAASAHPMIRQRTVTGALLGVMPQLYAIFATLSQRTQHDIIAMIEAAR